MPKHCFSQFFLETVVRMIKPYSADGDTLYGLDRRIYFEKNHINIYPKLMRFCHFCEKFIYRFILLGKRNFKIKYGKTI